MIKCVQCGTTNPDLSQFCDECGASLHKPATDSGGEMRNDFSDSKRTMIEPEINDEFAGGGEKSDFSTLAPGGVTAVGNSFPVQESIKPPEIENAFAAAETEIAPPVMPLRPDDAALSFVGHARLFIERGKSTGKEFILSEQEINIGRWDADNGIFPDVDLDADDPEAKISRRHARIVRYGEQYLIEDLGSTNGTFVNRGRRLLPGNRQILSDGDELIVGKTFLRFQIIK